MYNYSIMDVDYHGMKISSVSLQMWINMKLKGIYIYIQGGAITLSTLNITAIFRDMKIL